MASPMDAALDHIGAQGMELDAAKLALYEIRQAALPYLNVPGPAGHLASIVIGLVEVAPQYIAPEPEAAAHG